jgi:hypothetical protein
MSGLGSIMSEILSRDPVVSEAGSITQKSEKIETAEDLIDVQEASEDGEPVVDKSS